MGWALCLVCHSTLSYTAHFRSLPGDICPLPSSLLGHTLPSTSRPILSSARCCWLISHLLKREFRYRNPDPGSCRSRPALGLLLKAELCSSPLPPDSDEWMMDEGCSDYVSTDHDSWDECAVVLLRGMLETAPPRGIGTDHTDGDDWLTIWGKK